MTTYASANMRADDTMIVEKLQKEVKRLRSLLVDYANAAEGEGNGGAGMGNGGDASGGGGDEGEDAGAGGAGGDSLKKKGGIGGVLAVMEDKVVASEGESQRLRERVRALEEALKAEREQRRHMAKGFEEEKRLITSQLTAAEKALVAAEARAAAAVGAGMSNGYGYDMASMPPSPGRGGGGEPPPPRATSRSGGGVGAVAAARAARAEAEGTGSGGGGGAAPVADFSTDRFGSSSSYASTSKAPGSQGRKDSSPYAVGNSVVANGNAKDRDRAGAGLLRTRTRPTLNPILLLCTFV